MFFQHRTKAYRDMGHTSQEFLYMCGPFLLCLGIFFYHIPFIEGNQGGFSFAQGGLDESEVLSLESLFCIDKEEDHIAKRHGLQCAQHGI